MQSRDQDQNVKRLIESARDGDLEEVRRLLDLGVSPNAFSKDYDCSALHYAAWKNRTAVLTLLIERGGNPNIGSKYKNSSYRGAPPLECTANANANADDAIRVLLDNNANINMRRGDGCTVLFRAVYNNKSSTVRLLLAHHADITIMSNSGYTALSWAVINNKNLECTAILVDHIKQEYQNKPQALLAYLQKNNEFSRLISATENEAIFLKLMELIDFLIEKEIDLKTVSQLLPDTNTLQFAKFKESLLERFETLPINERIKLYAHILHTPDHPYYKLFRIQRGVIFGLFGNPCEPGKGTLGKIEDALKKINERQSELYNAAFFGNLNKVNGLLTRGAPFNCVNENGATPLNVAVQQGHHACVDALLKAGINVNLARHDGTTPLFFAAQKGQLACVDALLKAGANVNLARSNGAAPLYIAAQNGHLACVEAFLKAGANVNQACIDDGATPLYIAAQKGHLACVDALLKAGANVNLARSDGATPLYIAAYHGHLACVEELLAHGADINAKFTRNEEVLRKYAGNKSKAIQDRMNAFIDRQPNKNAIKMTAEDIAIIMGHDDIVALLQQHRNAAAPVAANELVTPSAPPLYEHATPQTNIYPTIHPDSSISYPKHLDSQRETATPSAPPPSYASLFPERVASLKMQDVFGLFAEAKPAENKYEKALAGIDFCLFESQSSQPNPEPSQQPETEEEREARVAATLEALPNAPQKNEEDKRPVERANRGSALPG